MVPGDCSKIRDSIKLFNYSLPSSSARSRGRLNSQDLSPPRSFSIGFVVILSSMKNRKDARYHKAGSHSDEKTERRELLQGIFACPRANIPCARSPESYQRNELINSNISLLFGYLDEPERPISTAEHSHPGKRTQIIREKYCSSPDHFKLVNSANVRRFLR